MVETQDTVRTELETRLRTASDLFERIQFARQIGMTFEGKRDLYNVLGYDRVITARQYRERYARGGIAGRVVDSLPKAVWRGEGSLFEDEDPEVSTLFEQEWEALNNQHCIWSKFQRVHILASLGSFAVLLIGGVGPLDSELPKGQPGQLLYVQPFGGGVQNGQRGGASIVSGADVTVETWEEDIKSVRFGLPKTYQLKRTNITSPDLQRSVHWSRVVHVPAPGFLDDEVYGPPALENVWNYLDDLDKVVGGGAEAFWLRANQGTHIDIDKKMPLSEAKNTLEELKKQAEAYEHQITRMMRTRGVTIKTLGSDVADFSGPADALLTLIAGTKSIPKRILSGSEMGQLASEQDRDNWNDQIKDCRTSYAQPIVVSPFINRLIIYGYLSKPAQWSTDWPDVEAMNELQKLDAAAKAASLNDHGEVVIKGNEIRETYLDREPLEESELQDTDQEQIDRLTAALRKTGTVSIAVKG